MRDPAPDLRRQYLAVAVMFALLLLATFALFAHLLSGQLSRSYLEDVLLSGRAQAEELARQLRGSGPLYKVVETRREALTRISATLAHQEIVDSAQVYDERGKLVWQTLTQTEGVKGAFPDSADSAELLKPTSAPKVVETKNEYVTTVPLENLGTVVLTLSKSAIAARIAILRRQLVVHTAIAAGVAVVVLAGAVGFIWHLISRNSQLEQSRRLDEELAALGSLAANLAHEIRNPLNALSINLELLEEDLDGRGGGVETVGLARREVGRLSRLVNDFLVYARPTRPSAEACDGRQLLDEVGKLLAPACERAAVTLQIAGEGVRVELDRAQMSQVLVNLALNAVQAMESSPRRVLQLACRENDEHVVFEVMDSGPGIPERELGRVREAFYTRRKGGTGLGLAIADRIVEAHDGRLELGNRAEGGLAARVVLPREAAEREG